MTVFVYFIHFLGKTHNKIQGTKPTCEDILALCEKLFQPSEFFQESNLTVEEVRKVSFFVQRELPKVAAQKLQKSFCSMWLFQIPFRVLPPSHFEYVPPLIGQPNTPIINAENAFSPALCQPGNYIVVRPSSESASVADDLLQLIRQGALDLHSNVTQSALVYSYYMPCATTLCDIKKYIHDVPTVLVYSEEYGDMARSISILKGCGILILVRSF